MRAIGPYITVSANMQGTLILEVQSDSVHVQTFWRNLAIPTIGNDFTVPYCYFRIRSTHTIILPDSSQVDEGQRPDLNRNPEYKAAVRLDIRDFLKFLQC